MIVSTGSLGTEMSHTTVVGVAMEPEGVSVRRFDDQNC